MQYYYEIAPTKIVRANSSTFTYASSQELPIGALVMIELGKKEMPGLIIKTTTQPTYETKEVLSTIEQQPLPAALITTALWMSTYYTTPLATVLQTLLPRGVQKIRRHRAASSHTLSRERTHFVPNNDQAAAIETITNAAPGTILLHGVTGSGKTHIYIEAAKKALAADQSVIVLVPEIALTSQIVDDFSHHFDDVLLTHSRQTEAERHTTWQNALHSKTARVAIGPRSALFMPLKNVGLIIIDEAHEPSFKQEQAPRYSALRAASILANANKGKVILGSATPLMSDYYLALQSNRPIITLNKRAQLDAQAPEITLVDSTKRGTFKRHRFLSDTLLIELDKTLASGHQALIFHNRRGSTSTTLCENCGWTAHCPRCFTPLTLHADKHRLECHICGLHDSVPTSCPDCRHVDIIHKGIGTKLIESELVKLYPNKNIVRFDADATADNSINSRYKDLYDGTIDIMIGTQAIAKGLDLPRLRTVGVVQADAGLSLPDYGASERTFQLIAQVVGRVGRSHHATSVVIQSYQPTHPAVIDGIKQDYAHFYETVLQERKRAGFPPFRFLMQLTCVYKTEAAAVRNAKSLAQTLKNVAASDVEILGPTPAFYERQHDTYRWQLLVKSPKRAHLIDLARYVPPAHWQIELDPVSIL